jgi:hypothetical protein
VRHQHSSLQSPSPPGGCERRPTALPILEPVLVTLTAGGYGLTSGVSATCTSGSGMGYRTPSSKPQLSPAMRRESDSRSLARRPPPRDDAAADSACSATPPAPPHNAVRRQELHVDPPRGAKRA